MLIRFRNPFVNAPTRATAARVTIAVSGAVTKLFFAAPAKLKPIIITIEPVTTGGSSQLTQPIPACLTIKPTSAKSAPVTRIPPRATAIPPLVIAAPIGARNAKEEPR